MNEYFCLFSKCHRRIPRREGRKGKTVMRKIQNSPVASETNLRKGENIKLLKCSLFNIYLSVYNMALFINVIVLTVQNFRSGIF